jgi:hypothetical protein
LPLYQEEQNHPPELVIDASNIRNKNKPLRW